MDKDMKWKTKEGKILDIIDMETSHIKNCINMLEKSLNKYVTEEISSSEHGFNFTASQWQEEIKKIEKVIAIFENELRLRKLGKPIGEDFPLPVIQRWEVNQFRNQ